MTDFAHLRRRLDLELGAALRGQLHTDLDEVRRNIAAQVGLVLDAIGKDCNTIEEHRFVVAYLQELLLNPEAVEKLIGNLREGPQ